MQIITISDQELHLYPSGALYWPGRNTLVISDLHLGKSGHFRKNGIPVPASVNDHNIRKLEIVMKQTDPAAVIFLGDLFHSDYNKEVERFSDWLRKYPDVEFILTAGNHDILPADLYHELSLKLVNELKAGPFIFRHDLKKVITEDKADGLYRITGHIHPGVVLRGKGRQKLRLPCFYFKKHHGILPAFGAFTGSQKVPLKVADSVYAIAGEEIIPLKI